MYDPTDQLNPAAVPAPLVLSGLFAGFLLAAGLAADVFILLRLAARRKSLSALAQRLSRRPWRNTHGWLILLVLGGMNGLLFMAVGARPESAGPAPPDRVLGAVVLQTLLFHGLGAGVVASIMRRQGFSWKDAFNGGNQPAGRSVLQGVFYYLAAMPAVLLVSLIYNRLLNITGYPIEPQPSIQLFTGPEYPASLKLILAALAVVIAPAVEEILFRGIALPLLLRRFNPVAAILLVSLAFAAIHMHVPSLAALFTISAAFALAYLATGSLLAPMVMHSLFNSFNLILLLLLGDAARLFT